MATLKNNTKRVIPYHTGGTNRAFHAMLPKIAEYNNTSEFTLAPDLVDVVPGRALAAHEAATALGVPSTWHEGSIEQTLAGPIAGPIVLHVDNPRAHLSGLRAAHRAGVPAVALLAIRSGSGTLFGFMAVLNPDDDDAHDQAERFLAALAAVTVRGSRAADVFSGTAEFGEHGLRDDFTETVLRELPRMANGVAMESSPLTLSRPGRPPATLVVLDPSDRPRSAAQLTEAAQHRLPATRRGTDVVIAEVLPGELKLHEARVRLTDARMSVSGTALLSSSDLQVPQSVRDVTAAALERAKELASITRQDAAQTSD
jgi:hypothetical protein